MTPNAIAAAVEERLAAGGPLLDLTETNPTRVRLPLPWHAVKGALGEADSVTYEPVPFGLPAARAAVSRYYGAAVPSEHIVLTASTSEAYAWLFKLLANPGDRVLVPVPSYPLFDYLAALESLETIPYPWAWDGDSWFIDFDALEARLDERSRAVVVVSPNNPTGAVLRRAEADRLLTLCGERRIAVIADEVFADHLVASSEAACAASLAGRCEALVFVLGGLSKTCLLPHLKVAWIAASGPPALLDPALERLQLVADTYLSVNTPVQQSLPRLLGLRETIRPVILSRLRANLAALADATRSTPATLLRAEGGWSAVLRVPRHPAEEERVLRLIRRYGVRVHPGYFFDFPSEAFLVLSLLPVEDEFARGAACLAEDTKTP